MPQLEPWNRVVGDIVSGARPRIVTEAAAAYRHDMGTMPADAAATLTAAVHDAFDDIAVVPFHGTASRWVPTMLDDGFAWPRTGRQADGWEPYEYKLSQWDILGAGERSEDILFAGTALLPAGLPLDAAIAARAATRPEPFTDVRRLRGNVPQLSAAYGPVSAIFGTDVMRGVTMLPHLTALGRVNLTAGTAEHLHEVVATRIAMDTGFFDERIARSMADAHQSTALWRPGAEHRQPLLDQIDGPYGQLVGNVRERLLAPSMQRPTIELHLRRPQPAQVVALHTERPLHTAPRVGRDGSTYAESLDLLDRPSLNAIDDASTRHGKPFINGDEQLAAWREVDYYDAHPTTHRMHRDLLRDNDQLPNRAAIRRP